MAGLSTAPLPSGVRTAAPNPSPTYNLASPPPQINLVHLQPVCQSHVPEHRSADLPPLPENFLEFSKATGQKPDSSAWPMNVP